MAVATGNEGKRELGGTGYTELGTKRASRASVLTLALLATMVTAPKERKYPHWAAAHTKATMGGQPA